MAFDVEVVDLDGEGGNLVLDGLDDVMIGTQEMKGGGEGGGRLAYIVDYGFVVDWDGEGGCGVRCRVRIGVLV